MNKVDLTTPITGTPETHVRRSCAMLRGLIVGEVRTRQKALDSVDTLTIAARSSHQFVAGSDAPELAVEARESLLNMAISADKILEQIEADAPIDDAGKRQIIDALWRIFSIARSSSWLFDAIDKNKTTGRQLAERVARATPANEGARDKGKQTREAILRHARAFRKEPKYKRQLSASGTAAGILKDVNTELFGPKNENESFSPDHKTGLTVDYIADVLRKSGK